MSPRRAVIVDDEPPACRRLAGLLAAHPEVEIVGQAGTVAAAEELIRAAAPDLLFLDVQLADDTAFALFDRVAVTAAVIFVTAFSEHAVRAFEVNALDYLVKPIDPARLAVALVRAAARPAPAAALGDADLVAVRSARGFRFVPVAEIVLIASSDDYSEIFVAGGQSHLSDRRMNEWERSLPDAFVRVHRRYIVRAGRVEALERRASGWALRLRGGALEIPVGRHFRDGLRERLGRR
jgi:two-component system, LytTR family, response regulator